MTVIWSISLIEFAAPESCKLIVTKFQWPQDLTTRVTVIYQNLFIENPNLLPDNWIVTLFWIIMAGLFWIHEYLCYRRHKCKNCYRETRHFLRIWIRPGRLRTRSQSFACSTTLTSSSTPPWAPSTSPAWSWSCCTPGYSRWWRHHLSQFITSLSQTLHARAQQNKSRSGLSLGCLPSATAIQPAALCRKVTLRSIHWHAIWTYQQNAIQQMCQL